MKSLRYLLVITWVCTMASLGLFSDIESLKDLFARCHFGGDANVPGIALLESQIAPTVTPKTSPATPEAKAPAKVPVCKEKWMTCTQKQRLRCKQAQQKNCKKRVCKPKEHAAVQPRKTDRDTLAVAYSGGAQPDARKQG